MQILAYDKIQSFKLKIKKNQDAFKKSRLSPGLRDLIFKIIPCESGLIFF